ncbi:MAG: hypothetical protein AB7E47_11915 [Desulfovibrionaceae bacterium]
MHDIHSNPDLFLSRTIRDARAFKLAKLPLEPTILIACFPCTGSARLVDALHVLTGFVRTSYADAFRDSEQNLSLPRLIDQSHVKTVARQHVKATTRTVELLHGFRIRPVVLVRDIHDTLACLYEQLHQGNPMSPCICVTDEWFDLPEAARVDSLVDFAAPWLIQCYASWRHVARNGLVETCWASSEQWTADPRGVLRAILAFHDIERTAEAMDAALATTAPPPAIAQPGQGAALFSDAQKNRIRRMASHYPWADFARIGITA